MKPVGKARHSDYSTGELDTAPSYPIVPRTDGFCGNDLSGLPGALTQILGEQLAQKSFYQNHANPLSLPNSTFLLDEDFGVPDQWVALTKNLIESLARTKRLDGARLSMNSAISCAYGQREEHLTAFRLDSVNRYNELYFSTPGSLSATPAIFNREKTVVEALGKYLARTLPTGDVRALELCAGEHAASRWIYAAMNRPRNQKLTVKLSDFVERPIPRGGERIGNLLCESEICDLRDAPAKLDEEKQFHAVVATYGFDSVWLPGDAGLVKHQGQWFESLHRIAIPDWHTNPEAIRFAFATGDCSRVDVSDFRQLLIERALTPAQFGNWPLLRQILDDRCKNAEQASIQVPGGMVNWITAAFANSMTESGVFIVADTGTNDTTTNQVHGIMTAGAGAKYKSIDFDIAKKMLEMRGFSVTVNSLPEIVDMTLGGEWRTDPRNSVIKTPNQYVMTVRNLH